MSYRRHISDVMETKKSLVFALVVRTEDNLSTLGGGYVTLRKPFTDAEMEKALDEAVLSIVRLGDRAFPRDKAKIRANALAEGVEDTGLGNLVKEVARGKNNIDWPGLRRGRP